MRMMESTARAGVWLCVTMVGAFCTGADVWAQQSGQSARAVTELEEIVVTGSRLKLPDEQAAAPVVVFDRFDIERAGVASVAELLQYIPQAPYVFSENFQAGGAQFAEMRGLGVDTTLILINGRRVVPSAVNVAANAFDLNTLPLAAIERIEVLGDAASAVYGADAVGGVINVVLKSQIERPVIEASVGSADGGGRERRGALSGGYAGERLNVALTIDYFDRDYLLGARRDRWADQDYTRYGSTDWRSANTNPGNVRSRTTENLPGLNSTFAAVPEGSSGIGLSASDFAGTAGERSLESLFKYHSVVSQSDRRSVVGLLDYQFTPSVSAFVDAMYVDRSVRNQSEPSAISNVRVPANNPFNPFGVDVTANFLLTGLGPREAVAESELQRAVAGLRGTVGSWDWEISGLSTREEASSWNENVADPVRVAEALSSTDPATALNVFMDGAGGSDVLLRSLITRPVTDVTSDGTQFTGFVRGPLLMLPAGALQVVAGAEARREQIDFQGSVTVDHDRDVTAVFAEARVPLVAREWQWPAVHELSLSVAGRGDDYSDFGSTFNPQYGLRWAPVRDLLLSASYGESFRAPALFELYSPRREIVGNVVVDPRRNGESVPVTLMSGGNPSLDPVEAESYTAGLVYTPHALEGFRFAANYWDVTLEGRVAIFSQQLVLENEAIFADRVQRAVATPSDLAAGLPGFITAIDISRINFGRVRTHGIDTSVRYSLESGVGLWSFNAAATWVGDYRAIQVPNTPAIERVGVANLDGSIPRWRGTLGVSWAHRGCDLSTTARYIGGYQDRTILGADVGRDVDSQVLVDLQARMAFQEWLHTQHWLQGLTLSLGVLNAFDKEPPFSEINALVGYDQSQGDLRGRFGYLRLSYEF